VNNAIHPKWRTAKTHVRIISNIIVALSNCNRQVIDVAYGPDDLDPAIVQAMSQQFQDIKVPIFQEVVGTDAGSYSNEGDAFERDFITTFYSQENYPKLSAIKSKYDPNDLFIVASGVGSERWDGDGLCKV
jgi:hypothetical protein